MSYEKIILVTRKTRLEELIERFNTRAQAQFYIEHSQGNFAQYEREHETYYQALGTLRRSLQGTLKLQVIERAFLPNFLFSDDNLIMTIGIDGLVVNTAKYLNGQPLIAVNPDPKHIDGVLLPYTVAQAPNAVRQVLHNQAKVRPITMAEARLADGQRLLAFNDLFIGRQDHASARYQIQANGRSEYHSSSGILVSTGAGATGWLSSMFNMTNGLASYFSGVATAVPRPNLTWESEQLVYVVREPFISKTSAASMVCGVITPNTPLVLESTMPEGGVIFSDGVAADYLPFNSSSKATICLAQRKTNLVVP